MTTPPEPPDGTPIYTGAYLRISRAADGSTLGVERQLPPVVDLIKRRGWRLAALEQGMTVPEIIEAIRRGERVNGVYCDNDLSAYSTKRRPDYERMLADAQASHVQALAAWHADRFTRRPAENEGLIDLHDQHGVQLATSTGEHDLANPAGRLHFRMLGVVARYESEHKSERVRLKMDELAAKGLPKGGRRPFGFEKDRVTHLPAEAELIREASRRLRAGEGLMTICRDWDQRKIPTTDGRRWVATILRRILTAPRTVGLREHRGEIVGLAAWAPILDREEWEECRRILLDDPARRKRLGPRRQYLLTGGIGRCGGCDQPIKSRPELKRPRERDADGHLIYIRCYNCLKYPVTNGHGCGKVSIRAEPLEQLIREAIIARLIGPGIAAARRAAAGHDERRRRLVDQLEAEETQLRQHDEDYDAGVLDRARWLRLTSSVNERIAQTRRLLDQVPIVRALDGLPSTEAELRLAWDSFSIDRRRALVQALLEAVYVDPVGSGSGRGFKLDRVRLVWKG